MDARPATRLSHKAAKEAIIARIAEDLRLTPFLARAYYQQMAQYFQQYAGLELQDNQVSYCAVADHEPAGKKLSDCVRLSVRLTLHASDDLENLEQGIVQLRRRRIARLCQEAHDQGALLTQEDLAVLLTTSVSTIKRDLRALRAENTFLPTRGQQRDIGPGTSHKPEIIRRYLAGESLTNISRSMRHGIDSMQRYLQAFRQVALMTEQGLEPQVIRKASRLSERLVADYQELFAQATDDPQMQGRLQDLLATHGSVPPGKRGRR